jgi:hypothetical protein
MADVHPHPSSSIAYTIFSHFCETIIVGRPGTHTFGGSQVTMLGFRHHTASKALFYKSKAALPCPVVKVVFPFLLDLP